MRLARCEAIRRPSLRISISLERCSSRTIRPRVTRRGTIICQSRRSRSALAVRTCIAPGISPNEHHLLRQARWFRITFHTPASIPLPARFRLCRPFRTMLPLCTRMAHQDQGPRGPVAQLLPSLQPRSMQLVCQAESASLGSGASLAKDRLARSAREVGRELAIMAIKFTATFRFRRRYRPRRKTCRPRLCGRRMCSGRLDPDHRYPQIAPTGITCSSRRR